MTNQSDTPKNIVNFLDNDDAAIVGEMEPVPTQEVVFMEADTVPLSLRLPLLVNETKKINRKIDNVTLSEIIESLDSIYSTYRECSTTVDTYRYMLLCDPIAINHLKEIFPSQIEDEFDIDLVLQRLLAFVAILTSVRITDTFLMYNPYGIIVAGGPILKNVYARDHSTQLRGDIQATLILNIVRTSAYSTKPTEPLLSLVEQCCHLQLSNENTKRIVSNMLKLDEQTNIRLH